MRVACVLQMNKWYGKYCVRYRTMTINEIGAIRKKMVSKAIKAIRVLKEIRKIRVIRAITDPNYQHH